MRPGQFLAMLAVPALAGCPGGAACEQDWDCSSGLVCANTHDCVSASEVRRVEVRWTLYGQVPTAASCAPIDRMELTVRDSQTDDTATYSPVPCSIGRFVFNKLPLNFDSAAMSAFVGGSFAEAEQSAITGDGTASFDFDTGSIVTDAMPAVDATPPDALPIDAGP